MPETRRQFTEEFLEGAVRIVRETGQPIAQVARELGINAGTLGNWVADAQHGPPARIGSPGLRRFGQGPPRQCWMRWWSGLKPCATPQRTAWVRLATPILR